MCAGDAFVAQAPQKLAVSLGLLMRLGVIGEDAGCTGEAADAEGLKELPEPSMRGLSKTSPHVHFPDRNRSVLFVIEAMNIGKVGVAQVLPA
jgi:hypothetical protein